MNLSYRFLKLIDKVGLIKDASAHCDIPCGIYDPHLAQLAAHTCIRMVNLIHEIPSPGENPTFQQRQEVIHKISRYTQIKEEHAEICKKEIRILWGDYFKPEHVEKFPELHDLVWKTMKLGSKVKQEINLEVSKELLETVQKIAEIFWKTKGLTPVRVKAPYPSGGDLVLFK